MKFTNKLLGYITDNVEVWGFDEEELRQYDGDYHDLAVTKIDWYEYFVHDIELTRKNGEKSQCFNNTNRTKNHHLEF